MLTIIWQESDLPITFKKRYSFWRNEAKCDMLTSGMLALLGTIGNRA